MMDLDEAVNKFLSETVDQFYIVSEHERATCRNVVRHILSIMRCERCRFGQIPYGEESRSCQQPTVKGDEPIYVVPNSFGCVHFEEQDEKEL